MSYEFALAKAEDGVMIRPLSLGDAFAVTKLQSESNDIAAAMGLAICKAAMNAEGKPLFKDADSALAGIPFAKAGALFTRILVESGMMPEEDAEKNALGAV